MPSHTVPLSVSDWMIAMGASAMLLRVMELDETGAAHREPGA
jgi:hypothetical protein